jgi:ubiquinone/menaquinone biosynthesis C-methylase UbiE
MREHNLDEFLKETEFCDYNNQSITRLSDNIVSGLKTDREKAVAIFNWVRDNIKYRVGLWQQKASQTVKEGFGTCTNKANLVVALLRLNNIPAGYGMLRTKGQHYIGPIVLKVLRNHVAYVSTHIYAGANLGGRWIKCDPSADHELSRRTISVNPQSKLVVWNGTDDGTEDLDPSHILSDKFPVANIDNVFRKRARNGKSVAVKVANLYIEYLRNYGIKFQDMDEVELDFFRWLWKGKGARVLYLHFKIVTWYMNLRQRSDDNFWAKYMRVYDILNRAFPYRDLLDDVIREGDFGKGHVVLDAGSGTGNISIAIKQRGCSVISIDNSRAAIALHREKDAEARIIISDLREKLHFPDHHFDRVICVLTLHTLSTHDREMAVSEFYRVLKLGGKVLLVNPSINFSSLRIFGQHLHSSLKVLGVSRTLYDVIIFAIPTIKMFYYNFLLKFGDDSYEYLCIDEQAKYLSLAGFKSISKSKELYAGSAVMNWAIK